VTAAGAVDNVPLGGSVSYGMFTIDGKTTGLSVERVLPGYFEAISLPALEGQLPTEADEASGRNLITISASARPSAFPGGSAGGRQLLLQNGQTQERWEVAAVVPDVRHLGALVRVEMPPQVYLPFRPAPQMSPRSRSLIVVLRTSQDIAGLADTMR